MNNRYPPTSVLIPVYYKDEPDHFEQALRSIFLQTVLPSEVLILVDGPVSTHHQETIRLLCDLSPIEIRVIKFPKNLGLPRVLNKGIQETKYSIIFRMDSDDIADEKRFQNQLEFLIANPDIDLLGGQIKEFLKDTNAYSRRRNPFNHMTVMYRKEKILEVGGYNEELTGFEDYGLWVRLIQAGARVENLNDFLCYVRTGKHFFGRRSGFKYVQNEVRFINFLRKNNFISFKEKIFQILIKSSIRFLPPYLIKKIYQYLLRKSPVI